MHECWTDAPCCYRGSRRDRRCAEGLLRAFKLKFKGTRWESAFAACSPMERVPAGLATRWIRLLSGRSLYAMLCSLLFNLLITIARLINTFLICFHCPRHAHNSYFEINDFLYSDTPYQILTGFWGFGVLGFWCMY